MFGSRVQFAAYYAAWHLCVSVAVVLLVYFLVFGVLYPEPYRDLLAVQSVFWVILVADVVCGPLLTLILGSPKKSRKERWLDLSLVGLIQIMALFL